MNTTEAQWSRALGAATLGILLALVQLSPCVGERMAVAVRAQLGVLAVLPCLVLGGDFDQR